MTVREATAIWSHIGTVGSKAGALIARSISSLPGWAAPLVLAALLAACNNDGGGGRTY